MNEEQAEKPKKVKKAKTFKATPKVNIGTNTDGSPRYVAGVEADFTKKQIDNYKHNKLI